MNTGNQNTGDLDLKPQNPQIQITAPNASPLQAFPASTPPGNSPLLIPASVPSYCTPSLTYNSPMMIPVPVPYQAPTPVAYTPMACTQTPMYDSSYDPSYAPINMNMMSPGWVGVMSPSLPQNVPFNSFLTGDPYLRQDLHNPFNQPNYNRAPTPRRDDFPQRRVSRSLRQLSGGRLPSSQQYLDRRMGRQAPRTSLLDILEQETYSSETNLSEMNLVQCALDKRKSLLLQKRIAKAAVKKDSETVQAMYHQFCPQILRLCRDQYANFVLQRLAEALPKATIDDLTASILKDAYLMATDQYACRVLQIIIVRCSAETRVALFNELLPEIEDLLLNNFGCYVLQKFVETMNCDDLKEFVEATLLPRVFGVSVHQYSCRVMQDVLRYFKPASKSIVEEKVLDCIVALCKNVYGNYVAQKLVHYGSIETRTKVVDALLDEVVELACLKSGSNLIEKLLSKCLPSEKVKIMEPLIATPEVLKKVVSNKFGNYVIQRLCVCLPDESRNKFRGILSAYFAQMKDEALNEYEAYVYQQISQNGSTSEE